MKLWDSLTEGEVKFPDHMMAMHRLWMYGSSDKGDSEYPRDDWGYTNVSDLIRSLQTYTAVGGRDLTKSPYHGVTAYNPALGTIGDHMSVVEQYVANFKAYADGDADPGSFVGAALPVAAGWAGVGGSLDAAGVFDHFPALDPASALQTTIAAAYALYETSDPRWGQLTAGDIDAAALALPAAPTMSAAAAKAEVGELTAVSVENKINNAVDAFESAQRRRARTGLSAVTGGLFDLRAVMTSTFDTALVQWETSRQDQVSEYDAQARLEQVRLQQQADIRYLELTLQRDTALADLVFRADASTAEMQARRDQANGQLQVELARYNDEADFRARDAYQTKVAAMLDRSLSYDAKLHELRNTAGQAKFGAAMSFVTAVLDSYRAGTAIQSQVMAQATASVTEYKKLLLTLLADEQQMNLQLEVKDTLWDLDLFKYGESMLAAAAGAPSVREPSKFERLFNAVGATASLVTGLMGTVMTAMSL
jgi:hypothetical protein